jgi:hypothetical protein
MKAIEIRGDEECTEFTLPELRPFHHHRRQERPVQGETESSFKKSPLHLD